MTQAVLGAYDTDAKPPVEIHVPTLVETRALIQANSGGGKSWAIRRLLEITFGQVQHIVLDPEGEFASLRERFDYVLAGREGDTPAEPRSAKLLARRLLELGVSAICDIYELKAHDRVRFVRYFLEALVDAPKSLWHPVLVIVDEAQVYAPQKGEAESLGAIVELAGKGRKRGFCAVLATRRISTLNKDVAAECLPAGSSVLTADGLKSIEDVEVGELVLTHAGRYRPVLRQLRRWFSGDLLVLRTAGCNQDVLVTPEHPFLVRQNRRRGGIRVVDSLQPADWVTANSLHRESYVVFPRLREVEDKEYVRLLYSFRMRYRDGRVATRDRSYVVPVDEELMTVVGYYLAEGSPGVGRKWRPSLGEMTSWLKVEFSFGKSEREKEWADDLCRALAALGFRASLYLKRDCWHVQCSSSSLAIWLRAEFGSPAHSKKIPLWVRRLPVAKLSPLLRAYLNGDGYRHPTREGQFEGRTVSADLAVNLREVMLKAGFDASLYRYEPHASATFKSSRAFWVIRAGVKSGDRGSLVSDDNALYLRLRRKEQRSYHGYVFNLEVAEDNSFCTPSQAVHNCNNKLIGRTGLDIDMRRAAEELGFVSREDQAQLRALEPGCFFAFGPALNCQGVARIKVGAVVTSHPKVGERLGLVRPAPTKRVKAVLAKLADLPAEAEQEARDAAALTAENARLRRDLSLARMGGGSEERVAEAKQAMQRTVDELKGRVRELGQQGEEVGQQFRQLRRAVGKVPDKLGAIATELRTAVDGSQEAEPLSHGFRKGAEKPPPREAPPPPPPPPRDAPLVDLPEEGLSRPQASILSVLASFEALGVEQMPRPTVAALAGASPTSSAFGNNLGRLRSLGYIEYPVRAAVALTDEGRALAEPGEPIVSVGQLHEAWYRRLPRPQAAILRQLIQMYPDDVGRDELAELVGASPSSSAFGNNLGRLRTLRAIEYPQGGRVKAATLLWPEVLGGPR